ncbi:MAG: hypothetical protein HY961_18860 [Ignavibacteriae bacterium]|nr:hypothetical protein [Ignavibacteriota bacterium]
MGRPQSQGGARAIDNIKDNYLNLPTLVHWIDGRKIEWLYDATGAKLRMSAYAANAQLEEVTDYVGGFS